jgi:thioredoxin-like negative regulator of GroEL
MAASPDYADGSVIEVTRGAAELRAVLDAATTRRQVVLVDYSAEWCGPCRMLAPVLGQLAREHAGRLAVLKVDCEKTAANQALARDSQVSAYPTLHLYADGQRAAVMRGADAGALRRAVAQQLTAVGPGPAAPGAMAAALAGALSRVKAGCAHQEEFMAAAQTLLAYVSNVLAHPGEPRFRRVKLANASFQAKVRARTSTECNGAAGCRRAALPHAPLFFFFSFFFAD